eukprot:TRINITY_DN5289_c0_g1_i2.p1 TRINITY_DN5289_c0_g1~~TRINITY_DN5289_c0_g1_i2.p1  ORF type:complete len:433 (+),score=58.36 TRINITY_DN5289_c0_g1_i2:37-1299(+)
MVFPHKVVVKNTFISLEEEDAFSIEDVRTKTMTRTKSDPTLRLSFGDNPKPCGEFHRLNDGTDEGMEAALSRGTSATTVGSEDSEDDSCSYVERSSLDTSAVPHACDSEIPAPMESNSCASVGGYDHPPGEFFLPHSVEEPRSPKQPADSDDAMPKEWQGKTSIMVRNISYKCTRATFFNMLKTAGFENLFDYVYLPVNAGRGTSKGYAFVNFIDDISAYRFKVRFDGQKVNIPGGSKRLEVIPANLQGYSQNASHYITKQNDLSITPKNDELPGCQQSSRSDLDRETSAGADALSGARQQSFGPGFDGSTTDSLGKSTGPQVMLASSSLCSPNVQHVAKPSELLSASKSSSAQFKHMNMKPAGYCQCDYSWQERQLSGHEDASPWSRMQASSRHCSQCSRDMLLGAKFCQWCGARVYGC